MSDIQTPRTDALDQQFADKGQGGDNAYIAVSIKKKIGIELKRCNKPGCGLEWMPSFDFDHIQTALAMRKRIESGESVEVRKVKGEWPRCQESMSNGVILGNRTTQRYVQGDTFPEAAAAWNKGAI